MSDMSNYEEAVMKGMDETGYTDLVEHVHNLEIAVGLLIETLVEVIDRDDQIAIERLEKARELLS